MSSLHLNSSILFVLCQKNKMILLLVLDLFLGYCSSNKVPGGHSVLTVHSVFKRNDNFTIHAAHNM